MPPVELREVPTIVDSSSTMSTEEKVAFELASDYIHHKVDKAQKPASKNAALLRQLGQEIEVRHELLLKNMCDRLNIQAPTAYVTFKLVADEIFKDGINWGRIVVLYTFGGKIATHCRDHNLNISTENVIRWIGEYVSGKSDWIRKAGGWDAFQDQFKDAQKEREQHWWNGLLYTTLGLGTLAAVMLVKG